MAILLLVLPLVFMLSSYASTAFGTGGEQADLQQNLRLAADFVVDELRYAEELTILEKDWDEKTRESYEYIYVDGGYLIHEIVHEEGDSEQQELLIGIRENIDLELALEAGDSADRLHFAVTGTQKDSGRTYDLTSEIRLLNTVIEPGTGDNGIAVEYKSPLPPSPAIRNVRLLHPDTEVDEVKSKHLEGLSGEDASVQVRVTTYQAPQYTDVELSIFYAEDPEDLEEPDPVLEVTDPFPERPFDDQADFIVEFKEDNLPGTYKIKATMDYGGDDIAVLTRSYVIEPTYTVSGNITDPDQNGVKDAEVQIDGTEYSFTTPSDHDGQFEITGVPADDYEVTVEHDEYSSWTTDIEILDDDVTLDIELTAEDAPG